MSTEPYLFTQGQRAIMRSLVLQEARRLGYGTEFHYFNRSSWPRRLKQLDIIAGQLQPTEAVPSRMPGLMDSLGREDGSLVYCRQCDTDTHRCAGCGAAVPHNTIACESCANG